MAAFSWWFVCAMLIGACTAGVLPPAPASTVGAQPSTIEPVMENATTAVVTETSTAAPTPAVIVTTSGATLPAAESTNAVAETTTPSQPLESTTVGSAVPTATVTPIETSNATKHSALEEEIAFIAEALKDSKERVYHWLDNPTGHMIVVPAMVGVLAALVTVGMLALCNCLIVQRCSRRRRQNRIARLTNDLSSEDRTKLLSKGGSDDEI